MKFNLVMNYYVFNEIFKFFKRSVETLCNLHNPLDAFICNRLEWMKLKFIHYNSGMLNLN